MERKSFDWREFFILWAAGVWGVIAVLPYTLTLQAPLLEKMPPLPVPLMGLVVIRVIVLNGVAGVVFGHLYWTRGLEAAMLAHFSADIVLHVLAPVLLGSVS